MAKSRIMEVIDDSTKVEKAFFLKEKLRSSACLLTFNYRIKWVSNP